MTILDVREQGKGVPLRSKWNSSRNPETGRQIPLNRKRSLSCEFEAGEEHTSACRFKSQWVACNSGPPPPFFFLVVRVTG